MQNCSHQPPTRSWNNSNYLLAVAEVASHLVVDNPAVGRLRRFVIHRKDHLLTVAKEESNLNSSISHAFSRKRKIIAQLRSKSLKLLLSRIKCIGIDKNHGSGQGKYLIGQLAQTRVPHSHVHTASSLTAMPSITDHHLWSVFTYWSLFGMISTLGKLWEWFGWKSIFRFRPSRPCSTPQPLQHVPASRIYLIVCIYCIYCYFSHSLCLLCVCTYLFYIGDLLHFNWLYLVKRPAWSLFVFGYSLR